MWPTPPASQRGEDLEVYEKRMKKRRAEGKQAFAPTLQIVVEMEERKTAQKISDIYDECIIGFNGAVYAYSSLKIIEKLTKEAIKSIENGSIDRDHQWATKEIQAEEMALDYFDYNISYYVGNKAPIFLNDYFEDAFQEA